MYRGDFFKAISLMATFLLLLMGCESRDTTEGDGKGGHVHIEPLESMDDHALGHVLHAMGVSATGEERLRVKQAVKVMYFAGDSEELREVSSRTDANLTVYSYENAYAVETNIDVVGSNQDSHIFVGVSSDIKKIIDMNLHGVKNDPAREFVKTFKGLNISDGRVDIAIDENDSDSRNILSTVNFIISSLAKTIALMN
ncbi:hypothetical protein [Borrelia sp. RT5S]|uniref:hypothetical protein n=1 Tax=Borrelia sp. RT5S TaxID=2898581 RepID=UPI001E32D5E5|nr:hypothetical protein [Borrelia sp. RT5S]UGQ16050.1 hypothetical protein LSO06_01845 [Borrelia sp. RT5S]